MPNNIEAFRVVGEILGAFRRNLRFGLEECFGPRWFETALSRELFARLVARKERERAVNSFNDSYFTLIEYADFLDLQEICLAHPQTASFLKALGGNPQIWQARLLELQTLHDKLAGLREVNEAELSFLQHLARRLHQCVPSSSVLAPDRSVWADRPAAASTGPAPVEQSPASPGEIIPPPAAEPSLPLVVARPPTSGTPGPSPAASSAPLSTPASPAAPKPSEHPQPANDHVESPDLDRALETGDDKTVIAALYREVLGLSEHILGSRGPQRSPVWDKVTESAWYARRFVALGLRPVSDFYNLHQAVGEQVREGATKEELQLFLQAHAFQQVVLAVGVFFHQNKVA